MYDGNSERIITFVPKVSGYTVALRSPDLYRFGKSLPSPEDFKMAFRDSTIITVAGTVPDSHRLP